MAIMAAACVEHFQASKDDNANAENIKYDFWRQHYRLDKIFATHLKLFFTTTSRINDARMIALKINLFAITIALHEIAIGKAAREALPVTLTVESKNMCKSAAVEIASFLRHVEKLDPLNVSPLHSIYPFLKPRFEARYLTEYAQTRLFKQLNIFHMWSLSSAAQVLSRLLKSSDPDAFSALASLQLIHSTMESLEDKSYAWDGLMQEIRVQVAGATSPIVPSSSTSSLNSQYGTHTNPHMVS